MPCWDASPAPGSARSAAAAMSEVLLFMRATPFHEGVSAWRSEGGLLAHGPTLPRLPGRTVSHQWLDAAGVPDHSGGVPPATPPPPPPPPPPTGGADPPPRAPRPPTRPPPPPH